MERVERGDSGVLQKLRGEAGAEFGERDGSCVFGLLTRGKLVGRKGLHAPIQEHLVAVLRRSRQDAQDGAGLCRRGLQTHELRRLKLACGERRAAMRRGRLCRGLRPFGCESW